MAEKAQHEEQSDCSLTLVTTPLSLQSNESGTSDLMLEILLRIILFCENMTPKIDLYSLGV